MSEQPDLDELLEPLRTDMTTLHVELQVLRQMHDHMAATLAQVGSAVQAVKDTVTASHEVLDDFVERYGRDQLVVNAQAELTQLTVEWKADFAQRERVRSLARGLTHTLTAQAVTSGLIDRDTIEACVREQFLLETAYWLAPAIMSVAARHNGESTQASRATAHAVWLDSAKAKLFFALTCSRLGELSEAAGWMDRYLNSLNRDDLGPEFTVVLEAIANAELGYDAYTYAREAMARWFREDGTAFQTVPAPAPSPHLAPWAARLMEFGRDSSGGRRFAALQELTGMEWPALETGWRTATALKGTLNFLESFPTVDDTPARQGRYADSALDHLIDQLEPDEAELQERMARLRALIKHGGDVEAAAAAADESQQDIERLDFATLLERAVFQPELLQLGVPARRLALDCVWESVRATAASMAQTSRSLLPAVVTLSYGDWTCEYSTASAATFDAAGAADELARHVEQQTREQIESIVPSWTLTMASAALALGCMAANVWYPSDSTSVLFLVLAVLFTTMALGGVAHVPLRKHNRRTAGDKQQAHAWYVLQQAAHELEDLLADWRHGLASAQTLTEWRPNRDREVES
ncbi:hypothetical protein [Streptomyces gilvus]|uniref:hypothetical protein n=1 Tax=Streptomyces gilvus TaxID=2920937 RepID=UPI001F10BC0B|nr:hypothetical protein [Streptomyces sp. CME 23]MCH5671575.1 hypothetical protein [Streptomyces sp. CME 23]